MNFNFEDEIHIRRGECKTPLKKRIELVSTRRKHEGTDQRIT
jgi:hypothetical protein